MAKKILNERCPLQAECERKCEYQFKELECDYYANNGVGEDRTIPDQEEKRNEIERRREEELYEAQLAETECDDEETPADQNGKGGLVYISVRELHQHPDNPRKDLGDLSELAESIKTNGILQNLTVVPNMVTGEISGDTWQRGYKVIIGHRRLAAAKMAGLEELPCVVVNMSEREQLSTMLTENMQRTDLTVYEQAQGFQMMLDMGDTVEDIAQKSGFSTTTVRRRVKLLELDKDKFKKSEERGATLFDYMELDKIKDIDRKNAVLDFIGTENFKYKLRQAIDAEKTEEKLAEIEAVVSTFATKVEDDSGYRYANSWGTYSKVEDIKAPDDAGSVEYFYIHTNYNSIRLLKKDEDKNDTEDLAAKERAAKLEARRSGLNEATQRAYELRSDFVDGVSGQTVKKHIADIMAAWICAEYFDNTGWIGEEEIEALLGVESDGETEDSDVITHQSVLEAVEKSPEKALLQMVYIRLDDSVNNGYYNRWNAEHCNNDELDGIYALLEKLGYEMSDDEKALQDGTHELFHDSEDAGPCTLCKLAHPHCDKCCKTCDDPCNGVQECRKESGEKK